MLNEVRRKPEKPRIWWNGHGWSCRTFSTFEIIGTGVSPVQAYVSWRGRNAKTYQPRPIGHN